MVNQVGYKEGDTGIQKSVGRATTTEENTKPFGEIRFNLGRTHPLYDVLGDGVASRFEPPYAWYIRVPDVPAFIQCIAPVLEE